MNKKLILSLLGVLFFTWFLSAANVSVMPSEGSVGLDCIEEFNISVDLWIDEKIIWADIVIDSNMEFVKFVNGTLFEYSAPAKIRNNLIKLLLFSNNGNEILEGGSVWKVYFKVNWEIKDPYVNFVFNGEGETTDTNLSIDWRDILNYVNWGKYSLDSKKACEHNSDLILEQEEVSLSSFVETFEKDAKNQRIQDFFVKYWLYTGLSLLLIILILFFLKKRKHNNV